MKYILVLMLGFVAHKGLEEVYDYSFEKAFTSEVCTNQYKLDVKDPLVDGALTQRFKCTYREMGVISKLSYVLARPHWANPFRGWSY